MRDEEKQIEEMAKDIYATGVAIDGIDIAYGVYDNDDHFHRMARKLYKAGYRKQRDTARAILQDLYNYPHEYHEKRIIELAKEYGVEVDYDR